MSLVDGQRHVRLYGPAFQLHDVRDVEAHVRTLLDAGLRDCNARLDAAKYDDALSYLIALCWRLSGLAEDGRTQRREHFADLVVSLQGFTRSITLGPFGSFQASEAAVDAWRSSRMPAGAFSFVGYRDRAPSSAYDPSFGLSFSTYSRRTLTRRIADWYRATFGDSRYGGNPKPISLDQLLDAREQTGGDETYLGMRGPGSRSDFVDELNRHAYYDPFEERDTRSVHDLGGPDRVAAAR